MKSFIFKLIIVSIAIWALFFWNIGCYDNGEDWEYHEPGCTEGTWSCEDNKVMFCGEYEYWETWQDCTMIGEACSVYPEDCSGFSGIACCN